MKLTLERDALLGALNRVGGIVARKSSIPILSNLLLTAAGSGISIRANNTEIDATLALGCDVAEAGTITVPASQLSDIAKSLPEGAQIKAEMVDGRLHVSAGRARWKLPTLDAEQFPTFSAGEWAWERAVIGAELADLIGRVSWAISNDAGKQFICGVRLWCEGGFLCAVGTQSRDIAYAKTPCAAPDFEGVTVPGQTCAEMVKFCADRQDVTLRMSNALVGLMDVGAELTSKVIGMPYASWRRIVDVNRGTSFKVDRRALAAAIRRAMIAGDYSSSGHAVRFTLTPGALSIAGRSAFSEALDEIECDYDGPELWLGVNSESAIDIVGMLKRDDVTFEFSADNKVIPLLIRCDGDDSILGISAPLKVA